MTLTALESSEFSMKLRPREAGPRLGNTQQGRLVLSHSLRHNRQSKQLFSLSQTGKKAALLSNISAQRSVVKVSYGKNDYTGQWAAHGKYLEREGAQKEGDHGRGFSVNDDNVSLQSTLEAWQNDGSPHLFRVIISPEFGDKSDLKAHARQLVSQLEKDLNCTLEWAGIDHYNTDHPHVHVVINGVKTLPDGTKESLIIPKHFMQYGIRQRSSELLTHELGPRKEKDIVAARSNALQAKRVTELDRILDSKADYEGRVEVIIAGNEKQKTLNQQLITRLKYLKSIGLAEKTGHISWTLPVGFMNALKQYQISQDIVKRRAQQNKAMLAPQAPLSMQNGSTIALQKKGVEGRVAAMGLHDELSDQRYIMLEGNDGRLHYITLDKGMQKRAALHAISAGDTIRLIQNEFNAGDRRVSYIAIEQNRQMKETQHALPIDKRLVDAWQKDQNIAVRGDFLNPWQQRYNEQLQQRQAFLQHKGILQENNRVNWQQWKGFVALSQGREHEGNER